ARCALGKSANRSSVSAFDIYGNLYNKCPCQLDLTSEGGQFVVASITILSFALQIDVGRKSE
uniref:LHFPL tetraspan subfamily member 5 n=1 Tax=Sus scrofa TaxID=9823 RepID=A0A8D0K4K9_PIG